MYATGPFYDYTVPHSLHVEKIGKKNLGIFPLDLLPNDFKLDEPPFPAFLPAFSLTRTSRGELSVLNSCAKKLGKKLPLIFLVYSFSVVRETDDERREENKACWKEEEEEGGM